ncbi:MAG: hypothetical protein U1B80_02815, partial [Anaerolineaceae bacterium]|nr:hypothetical protein [Anaerolineaceae bacterium]
MRITRWIGLTLLCASAVGLGWALLPPWQVSYTFQTEIQDANERSADQAVGEARFTLEHPASLRLGESGRVLLLVNVEDAQQAAEKGWQTGSEAKTNWVFETRLDMPLVHANPSDWTQEPYLKGQTLRYQWTIEPESVGRYAGTMWVYLTRVDSEKGILHRQALIARRLDIQTWSPFGLNLLGVRWIGL